MSRNKAQQMLEHQLENRITEIEKRLEEFKLAQPIGSDVLKTALVPTDGPIEVGPVSLPSSSRLNIAVNNIPIIEEVQLWNFVGTFYIDGDTANDKWPNGSNLSGGQLSMFPVFWVDWEESDESTGERVYKATIFNNDSLSHNIYFKMRAYIPAGEASAS